MAGVYTDNQPDFSWIQPYESKTFSQFWYPVQQIGPAQNANRRAAISLPVPRGHGARRRLRHREACPGASLALSAQGRRSSGSRRRTWPPARPLVAEVELPARVAASDLTLRLCDRAGQEVIRYTPFIPAHEPLPEAMTPQPPPEEIDNIEELYLTGVHLEQYKHPTHGARAVLGARPEHGPRRCAQQQRPGTVAPAAGQPGPGGGAFPPRHRAPGPRATPTRATASLLHNLGLALQYQGRYDEAYDAFTRRSGAMPGRRRATTRWRRSTSCAAIWAPRWTISIASLLTNGAQPQGAQTSRRRCCAAWAGADEALALVEETLALDKLDYWARNELACWP